VRGAIEHAAQHSFLGPDDATKLIHAYDLCWQIQMVSKLLTTKPLAPTAIGEGGRNMLLRETGFDDIESLSIALTNATRDAEEVIRAVLDRGKTSLEQE
jgi:glutamate-ammonia-ligase adenylyltransferase